MLFRKDMGPSGGGALLEEVGQGWVLSFYILLHILLALCFQTAWAVGQHSSSWLLCHCRPPWLTALLEVQGKINLSLGS